MSGNGEVRVKLCGEQPTPGEMVYKQQAAQQVRDVDRLYLPISWFNPINLAPTEIKTNTTMQPNHYSLCPLLKRLKKITTVSFPTTTVSLLLL